MRIHHLSCGTMCPFGGRLWDGHSPVLGPAGIVCHCLLIETEIGLVLVEDLEELSSARLQPAPIIASPLTAPA